MVAYRQLAGGVQPLVAPQWPAHHGRRWGYVRAQRKEGWFEVIAGKGVLAFKRDEESEKPVSSKGFTFVQTYNRKPKRRLFEVRHSQGHRPN